MIDTVMQWKEYGEYLVDSTELTQKQAYAIAGKSYSVDDESIATEVDSTAQSIRTLRSKVDLDKLGDPREFVTTPVPAMPFKRAGTVDYFMSDHWKHETGNVSVYVAVREDDEFVVVIEEYTETNDTSIQDADENGVVAVTESVEQETVYENLQSFMENSVHSPQNLPDSPDDLYISTEGELYD